MWDDFKAFKLRREDEAYQSTLRYGDISDRYLFIRVEPKTPEESSKSRKRGEVSLRVYDLLDTLYRDQKRSGNRDYIKPNMSMRNSARILSEHLSRPVKKSLICAIEEKKRTLKYLSDHYRGIVKQHKQVEMITMSFHLPLSRLSGQPREQGVRLMAALDELGQRFTRFKKLITSDPLFKAACGYTRLTMMNANYEPFYLINFFIKKLPDARIAPSLLLDLGKKWAEIFEDEDPEPDCIRYYRLSGSNLAARDSDERFLTLSANKITDVGQIENKQEKILEEKTIRKQVINNNQKGYLALFRLQSQVHNLIPGVRTLTRSNDFTYINTEVRKRRKSKKASIGKQPKPATSDAVSIYKETSGLRTSADDSTSPADHMEPEFYDILPSNLNDHLPWHR